MAKQGPGSFPVPVCVLRCDPTTLPLQSTTGTIVALPLAAGDPPLQAVAIDIDWT
ncbi:hypothetical protein CGRA01v4_13179 [Colletotrichum graminicola]|nr:hypothetical protein CGRA01v4_13179 [Colletotrichum graminicola]